MTIHKEGYKSLLFTGLFVLGVVIGLNAAWPEQTIFHYIVYAFTGLLFLTILQFFRHPRRKINQNPEDILCPADGKVVVIEKTVEEEYLKKECIQISVFMSPVNVHVNRYPVGGNVSFYKYHPGKFLVAWHPKSSTENERTTVVVDTPEYGPVLIRQIAGALARRIVCYSKEGQQANQGGEMGFIKFGSRVDVFIPTDARIHVNIGDVVRGGESLLASFAR